VTDQHPFWLRTEERPGDKALDLDGSTALVWISHVHPQMSRSRMWTLRQPRVTWLSAWSIEFRRIDPGVSCDPITVEAGDGVDLRNPPQ
jgi:hypothetical protein